MADACKICFSIIHGKHYRTLSTKNSVETYKEVLKSLGIECQGKACYICANKLNRIVNLKSDIAEKQKKCEESVQIIFGELQRMPGSSVPSSMLCRTPKHTPKNTPEHGLKRQRTPQTPSVTPKNTPKHGLKRQRTPQRPSVTPRSKKTLFNIPPKLSIYRTSNSSLAKSNPSVNVGRSVPPVSVGTAVPPVSVGRSVLPVSVGVSVPPVSVVTAVPPVSVGTAVPSVNVEMSVPPVSVGTQTKNCSQEFDVKVMNALVICNHAPQPWAWGMAALGLGNGGDQHLLAVRLCLNQFLCSI